MQITKEHLTFMEQAKEAFEANPLLETYTNDDQNHIALRMGMDRDCVDVYALDGHIANFVRQMEPDCGPRKAVRLFAYDMEKQLKVNDHRNGWKEEHCEYLSEQLGRNHTALIKELAKNLSDPFEITIRCANIANYAMMIADNKGHNL
jgi:hypothetical protein